MQIFNFDLNIEEIQFDKKYLIATGILLVIGLIILYSASTYMAEARYGEPYQFIVKQLVNILIGGALSSFIFFFTDYRGLENYSKLFIGLAILLLIWTKIYGEMNPGLRASRWIMLFGFSFQTSEFVKLALIIYLASFYHRHRDRLDDFKTGFLPPLTLIGISSLLIIIQPDYSTAAVLIMISAIVMFIGGAKIKHMLVFLASFVLVSIVAILKAPYRMKRITSIFNSNKDLEGAGYQLHQSLISLGNGGLFGEGLGNGVQKELFLPDCHTDFVFSVAGEELGFIISTGILATYVYLFWRGIKISMRADKIFGKLLGIGLNISLFIYVLLNVGVVCGILPVTGLPLPFISYGGSAMLYTLIVIGITLNISKYNQEKKNYKRDYIIDG